MQQRILIAARDLLLVHRGISAPSIEEIAQEAGVARMSVYYQFASKSAVFEALYDALTFCGGILNLNHDFLKADPLAALDQFIAVFGRTWDSQRPLIRRLYGLGALDPVLEQVFRGRSDLRWQRACALVGRLTETFGRPAPESIREAVDILHTLTSFETFDCLAGPKRSPLEVVPVVQRLARAALGLAGETS